VEVSPARRHGQHHHHQLRDCFAQLDGTKNSSKLFYNQQIARKTFCSVSNALTSKQTQERTSETSCNWHCLLSLARWP
jgi:hypothetical protein